MDPVNPSAAPSTPASQATVDAPTSGITPGVPAFVRSESTDPTAPSNGPDSIDLQATFQAMKQADVSSQYVDHDHSKPFGWVDHAFLELMKERVREDNGRKYREFDLLPDSLKVHLVGIAKARYDDKDRTAIQPHELSYVRAALESRGLTLSIKQETEIDALRRELRQMKQALLKG